MDTFSLRYVLETNAYDLSIIKASGLVQPIIFKKA